MTSSDYTQMIDARLRRLELLEVERDKVAGEIEECRELRRGAKLRERFERECQELAAPIFMEIVDAA
jgi:hypothetical protein